jgi:hypothetical protein
MKNTFVFVVCALFTNLTTQGQNTIKWGLSGGVAFSKPALSNVIGSEFKEHRLVTVAPTGINLSMDVNKHWNMEFSYSFMNTMNFSYDFVNELSEYSHRSSGQTTQLFSFKYKRRVQLSEKIALFPYFGLSHIAIDQGMGYKSDPIITSTSIRDIGGIAIRDTFFTTRSEITNFGFGLDLGAEVQFKIADRLYLSTQINYMHNPETHTIQNLLHVRDDGDPSAAIMTYKSSAFFVQAGIKWHWKDMVSLKSKVDVI